MAAKKLSRKERTEMIKSNPKYRAQMFSDICSHLRDGYSLDCFGPLSEQSILDYTKLYPEEFVFEDLVEARREGKEGWESIGRDQATGKCLGNSRSWYYNMANRYGWRDKIDIEAQHSGQVQIEIVNYATKKPVQTQCESD